MHRGGAQQPICCVSHCPSRQDCRPISEMNAFFAHRQAWNQGWLVEQSPCQEWYLLFCFALTRFDLYRTKCFFSPWMKALLFIPVNAIVPHGPLCQERLCHDIWIFYFCWKIGQIRAVEHSTFTCRFLLQFPQNSGSEIQVLFQAWCFDVHWSDWIRLGCVLSGKGCRAQLHCGGERCTGTGSQSGDSKPNLGREKAASSSLAISSAESVPGPAFANSLATLSRIINIAKKQDSEKHDNAASLFYIWHGLRFLAKVFGGWWGRAEHISSLVLAFAPAVLNELFPWAGEGTSVKNWFNACWSPTDCLCITRGAT